MQWGRSTFNFNTMRRFGDPFSGFRIIPVRGQIERGTRCAKNSQDTPAPKGIIVRYLYLPAMASHALTPSTGGVGGHRPPAEPMYDEATARKMLEETVLLSAEDTRDGEPVVGFDPDDAALDNTYESQHKTSGSCKTTPMLCFAAKGDLKMCHYLVSRGASTVKACNSWCPMYTAARGGQLEVCKFLQANGACHDIWKETTTGWTPFHEAAWAGHNELVRWLVLQGALCADASSETIEGGRIYPRDYEGRIYYARPIKRACGRLVEWANEALQSHSSLVMFLRAALPPDPGEDQSRTLQCLSGQPGVRKYIAEFIGMDGTKAKQLRILRQVANALPSIIASRRWSRNF